MELPTYHMPQPKSLMIHLWDKLKGYVKKAFTIILASTIVIWFLQSFTFDWKYIEQANPNDIADEIFEEYKEEHKDLLLEINEEYIENDEVVVDLATLVTDFNDNEDDELAPKYEEVVSDVFTQALVEYKEVVGAEDYVDSGNSILAGFGKIISPIFTPLGFGSQLNENGWVYGVSAITGLIAKENVIATFTVLSQGISTKNVNDVESYIEVYNLALDEDGLAPAISTAKATGIEGNGFTGWSVLIAFIIFNMTTIPCFAAVATAKGELVNKRKFWNTILFWLGTSFIVSSAAYLMLSVWWTSFIILALCACTGVCIYLFNKNRPEVEEI